MARELTMLRMVLTITVSFLILVVAGLLYTNFVQHQSETRFQDSIRQSEQRWCAIVGLFDDTYRSNPPTTPTGRRVADLMHELRVDFRCPPTGE